MTLANPDGSILLDMFVEQSRRNRIEAELDADLAREMARDPKGFNGKFTASTKRVQKCPICGGQAVSADTDDPYCCKCGWRSDKANGNAKDNS